MGHRNWDVQLASELHRLLMWFANRSDAFRKRAAQASVWRPALDVLDAYRKDKGNRDGSKRSEPSR